MGNNTYYANCPVYCVSDAAAKMAAEGRDPVRVAEIGVYRGETSHQLLRIPQVRLTMVDPWVGYWNDFSVYINSNMEACYEACMLRTRFAADRRTVFRMESAEAERFVSPWSLDTVFVDANHKAEYALRDMLMWFPKLRVGGKLFAHDYDEKGPKTAADRFVKMYRTELARAYEFKTFVIERRQRDVRRDCTIQWVLTKTYLGPIL